MQVSITQDSLTVYPQLGTYRFIIATCGRTEVHVVIAPKHVTIAVNNASHKTWRGLGKDYPSFAAARGKYRSESVQAILLHLETAEGYERRGAGAQ